MILSRHIAFVDIDHTISDAWWRDKIIDMYTSHLDVPETVWNIYHHQAYLDDPIREGVALVKALRKQGFRLVLLTARPEYSRVVTEGWLKDNAIDYDILIMRPNGNRKSSPQLKVEQAFHYAINSRDPTELGMTIIVDDRDDVIAKFVAHGITGLKFVSPKGVRNVNKQEEKAEEAAA